MSPIAIPPTIDWLMVAPVLVVAIGGVLALMLEMFRPKADNTLIIITSLISLALAIFSLGSQLGMPDGSTFAGMVHRDRMGLILQMVLCASTFLVICFSEQYLRERRIPFAEFYPLALWATSGAMIMVSSENLLMIFLGLEALSIALYVMAGMAKQEHKSEESAVKYFLLGSFASAILLFGVAYIYGATGSLDMSKIAAAAQSTEAVVRIPLLFGVAMLLIGLLFKAAYAPFHQWTPDVYQGAPMNVTAFMASVSKVSAIGALFRLLENALPMRDFYMPILIAVAVLTMIIGNTSALVQNDVKRIFAYSSIANAGYILVGLIAHLTMPDQISLTATKFYVITYAVTTMGAFAVLTLTARRGKEGTSLQDLNGLWKRDPIAAFCFAICVFSLLGTPPLNGFLGKLFIIQDAVKAGLLPLAVLMVLTSVVSMFYYLKIVRATWVEEGEGEPTVRRAMPAGTRLAVYTATLVVVFMSIALTPVTRFIEGTPEPSAPIAMNTNAR